MEIEEAEYYKDNMNMVKDIAGKNPNATILATPIYRKSK